MIRCTKCVLPDTYPGIRFDANGVCNFCRNFQPYLHRGETALREMIEPFRNYRGKYECIVALSGGRDSSYVLYYVVNELKLRPLVVTCDNGFMPDETVENVANAIGILGVDCMHIRQSTSKSAFRPFLRAWQVRPDPALIACLCNGCQGAIKKAIVRVARSNGVHLVIGGGGELVGSGGEPEYSFAEPLLRVYPNFLGPHLSLLCGALKRLSSNSKYARNPSLLFSFLIEAYYRFWYQYPKDLLVLGLFEFVKWNERHIVDIIRKHLKWVQPACWPTTWRADCKVHWLKEYLYNETLGFTKNEEILSGMVRENMLTREEAFARLNRENILPEEFLGMFLKEHGVDLSQLRETIRRQYTLTGPLR